MAKKKDIEVPAETKAIVVEAPKQVASVELQTRLDELKENFESVDTYRLPRAKMTAEGWELIEGEALVKELTGVILHTQKKNVYYAKPFNRNDVQPPDCKSADGVKPDDDVKTPVHKTCKGCPMAEFGTNTMKSGKACRNLKPLYMLLSDDSIIPRQVTIAPSSLRAANQYLMDLTERGLLYRRVKTKITAFKKVNDDTFMTLKFSIADKLTVDRQAQIDDLKRYWLPIMEAQTVDQAEVETVQSAPATSKEF